MLENNSIGERISSARIATGLSEEQFANRLGVKRSSVEHWEAGSQSPRANRINQMAGILQVPVVWLLAGGDDLPDDVLPDLSETRGLEEKISRAEQLVNELSFVLTDLRRITRRVQRDIDVV